MILCDLTSLFNSILETDHGVQKNIVKHTVWFTILEANTLNELDIHKIILKYLP